jgi:hypothetical protein
MKAQQNWDNEMYDIFLSYASKDRLRAKKIAEDLHAKGFKVWWDRDIPPGEEFEKIIIEAINDSSCVVVLWSIESIKSINVKDEARIAYDLKKLKPAKIDNVDPPYPFGSIQSADLTNWEAETNSPEFNRLINAIKNLKAKDDKVKVQPPPPPDSPDHKANDKKRIILISCLTLFVIISTIFSFKNDLFVKLWDYDPFLVYYIIGTLALLTFVCMVLRFTPNSADRIDHIKSLFILFAVLVTIAVIWRGIIDLVYILGECKCNTPQCQPPGLYTSHTFLPYVALFAIAVPALFCIITKCIPVRSEQEISSRWDIRKHLKNPRFNLILFCIYLIICRLAWEILDQITKHYKPCF